MKKLINIVYALILFVVVFFAGSLFLSRTNAPFAYKIYSVESGSMEPNIHVGSVVVVIEKEKYEVDDVITFLAINSSDKTVTHRIVEISEDEDIGKISYRTKGDANEDADSNMTDHSKVIGKVIFSAPYVGYPVGWAKTQEGFIALIVVPATIIVYSELNNIKKELKKLFGTKNVQKDEKRKKIEYDTGNGQEEEEE